MLRKGRHKAKLKEFKYGHSHLGKKLELQNTMELYHLDEDKSVPVIPDWDGNSRSHFHSSLCRKMALMLWGFSSSSQPRAAAPQLKHGTAQTNPFNAICNVRFISNEGN